MHLTQNWCNKRSFGYQVNPFHDDFFTAVASAGMDGEMIWTGAKPKGRGKKQYFAWNRGKGFYVRKPNGDRIKRVRNNGCLTTTADVASGTKTYKQSKCKRPLYSVCVVNPEPWRPKVTYKFTVKDQNGIIKNYANEEVTILVDGVPTTVTTSPIGEAELKVDCGADVAFSALANPTSCMSVASVVENVDTLAKESFGKVEINEWWPVVIYTVRDGAGDVVPDLLVHVNVNFDIKQYISNDNGKFKAEGKCGESISAVMPTAGGCVSWNKDEDGVNINNPISYADITYNDFDPIITYTVQDQTLSPITFYDVMINVGGAIETHMTDNNGQFVITTTCNNQVAFDSVTAAPCADDANAVETIDTSQEESFGTITVTSFTPTVTYTITDVDTGAIIPSTAFVFFIQGGNYLVTTDASGVATIPTVCQDDVFFVDTTVSCTSGVAVETGVDTLQQFSSGTVQISKSLVILTLTDSLHSYFRHLRARSSIHSEGFRVWTRLAQLGRNDQSRIAGFKLRLHDRRQWTIYLHHRLRSKQ